MTVTFQEWVAAGIGVTIGAFFGWLLWPWVHGWRERHKQPPGPPADNTDGPDTYHWQDADG